MKQTICTIFVTLWAVAACADPVELRGAIGPYDIEAELQRIDGALVGRYRYAGRDAWIDLSGEAYGQDAIQLNESVGGEQTGAFFLGNEDGQLVGFWAGGGADFEAGLTPVRGDLLTLMEPEPPIDISNSITGQYAVGHYWVNDWFAPNYEIGFTGGTANVLQIAPNQIFVNFQFVVGPTYHIAAFQGGAKQTADGVFVHASTLSGGDEPCRLVFSFDPNEMSIEDENTGYACQFGARAHANFNLMKISDMAEFDGSW